MRFALIVCTYMRPEPMVKLLNSVKEQSLMPDQVLVIDGSTNLHTKAAMESMDLDLDYYLVEDADRGLTRQRNYGVARVDDGIDIVCFLDDDIVLTPNYFEALIGTYRTYPKALGVGGYIIGETKWSPLEPVAKARPDQFAFDQWVRPDGSRFVMRKRLGLDADRPPAHLPEFSHGRSVSFLPPSGKTYRVEQFMGGVSSFKLQVLKEQHFSHYFEGYGLYEDAEYTLRLSRMGELYVNTAAKLYHYHEASGRPNRYHYGKMVIRNGWFVWRSHYPDPSLKNRVKWHATAGLLSFIRFTNAIKGPNRMQAWTESLGRLAGWLSLWFNKPSQK